MAAPRPILKSSSRKSSTSSTSSCDSISAPSSPCSKVQFSPCLSTTYLTHGSLDYNRSPITVTPNNCAMPKRGGCRFQQEAAALAQFRLEAEGRTLPALVSDDGFSSSDSESDSMPPSPIAQSYASQPSYAIPASLLKSSRSTGIAGRRASKPAPRFASSIPRPTFDSDGRDDIFGGF